ncbi:MAG: hypothetical protein A2Y79_01560 [Deltaproteobacteria bacterium RBG_13_43_22]|nr:MAG: hypothetical protein A2Y79_01560 [Deltaproteobacteria bacterium RBG_13_43_22]
MKNKLILILFALLLTTSLQIRLSHDIRKGYSYTISGSSTEEIVEADQKMRQYLKSLVPKKNAGPAPSASAPKPAPVRK